MKIVWNSFIHRFIHFTHECHALKTRLITQINVLMDEYEPMNEQILHEFNIFL
jgi:hypothetical protein